jgi:alanine-synthesizing transaminase
VVTIGSKEGIAHLLLALVGPGDCVLAPDPGYPIHQWGVVLAGGQPVPIAVGPDKSPFGEIEAALARAPKPPVGLIVNYPHNPTTATADLGFYERVVELARREKLWVISDLAYADLLFEERPAPSIFLVKGAREVAIEFFTVSKSYSMPGWRVGFAVGNPDLVGGLTTIKGYLDYGSFAPTQLAAATALTSCDRGGGREPGPVPQPRGGAGGGPERCWLAGDGAARTMFLWASHPDASGAMGAVGFAAELLEKAGRGGPPGVGFRRGRRGLRAARADRADDRVRRAAEQIGKFLKS